MLLEFFASSVLIAIALAAIIANTGKPVLQTYSLIAVSYLHIFPSASYFLQDGKTTDSFLSTQLIIYLIFTAPLLIFYFLSRSKLEPTQPLMANIETSLSPILPLLYIGLACVFFYVAITYNLFVRRIGFRGLEENSSNVPFLLLAIYRIAVETSFFTMLFLFTILVTVKKTVKFKFLYMISFGVHAAIFLTFFFVNSRLQMMVALFCLAMIHPRGRMIFLKKRRLINYAVSAIAIIFVLTIIRELFLETNNNRVSSDGILTTLYDVLVLISDRVNSVAIINKMMDENMPMIAYNSAGLDKLYSIYYNMFFDYDRYTLMKSSLETSPSEAILYGLFRQSEVDFQKSILLDPYLTFGWPGVFLATVFSVVVGLFTNGRMVRPNPTKIAFIVAIFMLPSFLEFEKELFPHFISLLKWSPIAIVTIFFKPRYSKSSR